MRNRTENGSEEWGYIPLRPSASMFYWFYRTTHPDGYLNRPIVLWLQGGSGFSGTGLGNFLEFGPVDQKLEPRNATWLQSVNVLFVDSPVDVDLGFSLVENSTYIPKTLEKISNDLISMLLTFLLPNQSSLRIWTILWREHKANQKGESQCNLTGVGIGNGNVFQEDFTVTLAPMLYEMSLIDDVQYKTIDEVARDSYKVAENGNWSIFSLNEGIIFSNIGSAVTGRLNPNNILQFDGSPSIYGINIAEFMNGPVREKLGIIPDDKEWVSLSRSVRHGFTNHDHPALNLVDSVLKESDIDVVVYSGQLDLMCNTAGALRWIYKLTWDGMKDFDMAEKKMLTNPDTDVPEMFVKSYENLKFYWVLNSGHVVPADVPDVAFRMLNRILDDRD